MFLHTSIGVPPSKHTGRFARRFLKAARRLSGICRGSSCAMLGSTHLATACICSVVCFVVRTGKQDFSPIPQLTYILPRYSWVNNIFATPCLHDLYDSRVVMMGVIPNHVFAIVNNFVHVASSLLRSVKRSYGTTHTKLDQTFRRYIPNDRHDRPCLTTRFLHRTKLPSCPYMRV